MAILFVQNWKLEGEDKYFTVAENPKEADESYDAGEITEELSEYGAHPETDPIAIVELKPEEEKALAGVYWDRKSLLKELDKQKFKELRRKVQEVF